jgi:hypothetical protein
MPTNPTTEAATAAKVFTLSDLPGEPLEFKDSDGKIYDVKTTALFGAREMAAFRRILRRYYAAQRTLESSTEMPEAAEDDLIEQLEQMLDQVLETLMPTLPPARVKALPFVRKAQFLDWWQQEQTPSAPAEPVGEAPGQPSTPA